MTRWLKTICIFILICSVSYIITAQNPDQEEENNHIRIIQANSLKYDEKVDKNVRRLIGNVILAHEGARMYCDSAHYNGIENRFKAYQNVKINQGDTLFLYSD